MLLLRKHHQLTHFCLLRLYSQLIYPALKMDIRILTTTCLLLLLAACGNGTGKKTTGESAAAYNEKLIGRQSAFINAVDDLNTAVGNYEYEQAEKIRLRCVSLCDSAIALLKAEGPYANDEEFWMAALKYYEAERKLYVFHWKEALEVITSIDASDGFDNDLDIKQKRLEELAIEIDRKNLKYQNDLIAAQKAFAKRHQFLLTDNTDSLPAIEDIEQEK